MVSDNAKDSAAKVEIISYLSDPSRDLSSLHRFPKVKQLFVKYNTALPSPAPVERLFSTAGLIETPHRNKLGDKRFDQL